MWPPEATGDDWTHPKQCLWFPQSCHRVTQNSQKYQVYFFLKMSQARQGRKGRMLPKWTQRMNEWIPPSTFYLLGPFMCTHEKPEAGEATRHQHRAGVKGNRYESDEVRLTIKTGANVCCKAACRCATPVQAVAAEIAQPVWDLPHRFCHTLK